MEVDVAGPAPLALMGPGASPAEADAREAAEAIERAVVRALHAPSGASHHGGSLIVARLLAHPHSGLRRLLGPAPAAWTAHELAECARLSADLLEATTALLGAAEHAPRLLLALEPRLVPPPPGVARDSELRCVLDVVCVLLAESAHCRRAALRAHAGGAQPAADLSPAYDCALTLPRLIGVVEALAVGDEAHDLLVMPTRALASLLWDGRPRIPRLHAWLAPGAADDAAPVFARLLGSAMPWRARHEGAALLQLVLEDASAFDAFVNSPDAAVGRCAAAQLAAMLVPGAGEGPTAGLGEATGGALEEADEELDEDELACATPGARGAAALRRAALHVFSSAVVGHADAARHLRSSRLDLALPARLVAILQTQVHHLLQRHAEPAAHELGVIKESLLLLLELARSADLAHELAGGAWIADLVSVTSRLVKNEVHPELVELGLPAKLLQNAVRAAR